MPNPFKYSYRRLLEIGADVNRVDRNEATTRLQLIDRIFFECLGWDRNDCEAEVPVNGLYADYTFRVSNSNCVVEAKREGTYFDLPSGTTQGILDISHFKKHNAKIYAAIAQAIKYCTDRGIQLGVVSNGHQMIAFLGSRIDGVSPHDGNALIFPNVFDADESNFMQLWDTLSKPGLLDRNFLTQLGSEEPIPPPEKASVQLTDYPGNQDRDDIQVDLRILAEVVIQDISMDEAYERDFLEKCYANSGALSQYALLSRRILETRYEQLNQQTYSNPQISSATTKSGINTNLFSAALAKRPILLIGDVGVGKTTFIRNWIQVAAREIVEKSIALYIDLGVRPSSTDGLSRYVSNEITRQLRSGYDIDIEDEHFLRGVYNVELQNFDRTAWGRLRNRDETLYLTKRAEFLEEKAANTEEHLGRCIEHIVSGRKRQVVVFFDNLDQRFDEFQQESFLFGQNVANMWLAMVFMTLRPETYHRSRTTGALNAYHHRAFTIAPPRIDLVVEKRLRYAVEMLEGGHEIKGRIFVNAGTLKSYLTVLANSFRDNRSLMEFIDNMCGGNVRLALRFIEIFVGSGHVEPLRIIDRFEAGLDTGDSYSIPLHYFLRAVMYGDYFWFDPRTSDIKNVFDITENDGREHFIVLNTLAYLERQSQLSGSDGYVGGKDVFAHLGSLGFRITQIESALRRMLTWKIVDTTKIEVDDESVSLIGSRYRLASTGSYYFRKLATQFVYLDAIVIDTPIIDDELRSKIPRARTMQKRLERATEFCEYLDSHWRGFRESGSVFDWTALARSARRERKLIKQRIERLELSKPKAWS